MRLEPARNPLRLAVGVVLAAAGCGGAPNAESLETRIDAADVEGCLADALGAEGWSDVPLSDRGTVYGVDFGSNSVLLYVEPDESAVRDQVRSIREAEDAVGNTGPGDRVILRERGNVLVSWPNEPTSDQRELVERCVGFP